MSWPRDFPVFTALLGGGMLIAQVVAFVHDMFSGGMLAFELLPLVWGMLGVGLIVDMMIWAIIDSRRKR